MSCTLVHKYEELDPLVSFLSFVDQSTFHDLHSSIFNSNRPIGALGRKIQARDKKGESQIQPLSQRHFTPSSAGYSVKQHFPGCQRSCFTLCAAHDLVSENLVKSLLFLPNAY